MISTISKVGTVCVCTYVCMYVFVVYLGMERCCLHNLLGLKDYKFQIYMFMQIKILRGVSIARCRYISCFNQDDEISGSWRHTERVAISARL
jgi:hypothetical protein